MSDVATTSGTVRGVSSAGIDRYLGIPYAAAPVGGQRFAPPAPHPGWDGLRDATAFGPTAPQAPYPDALRPLLATVEIPGDEYLNLNVWAPRGASGLPVMVWVHGGALSRGTSALDGYDGTTFARDGVVFVSLNYRLGTEGFSVLDGAEPNPGLADVLAALRWVNREIAAFGGDPGAVTVFGQSAGGNLIAAVLAHPDAPALVSRAIIQSGPLSARPPKQAGRITRLTARHLGIRATRDAFAAQPSAALVDAQQAVTAGTTPITGGPGFAIAVAGALVPTDPADALVAGAADGIPLLIGSTTEEYRLWFVPGGLLGRISPLFLRLARLKFRIGARVMAAYRRDRPDAGAGELLGALATDLLLRIPLTRWADARLARGATTHVYEFRWPSPVQGLGAAHAVELGFVFDRVEHPDSVALAGAEAPQELADAMHSAWIAFAKTGDPGWEPWDARRPTMAFDTVSTVDYAPREHERASWE